MGKVRFDPGLIVVAIAGVLFGLLGSEAALRLLMPKLPPAIQDQFTVVAPAITSQEGPWNRLHEPDPYLGYKLRPSMRVVLKLRSELKPTTITTNALGFRGPDPKDATVIVVGDSMAFGYGVNDDETSTSRLGAILHTKTAALGISGFSPSHYNRLLYKYALPNHPALVLFYLYLGNDFGGVQVLDDGPVVGVGGATNKPSLREYAAAHSIVYQMIKWMLRADVYRHGRRVQEGGQDIYFYMDDSAYDLSRPNIQRNVDVVEENLQRAWARCRQAGVNLAFVLIPTKESVYRDLGERHLGKSPFFQTEEHLMSRLLDSCKARGWNCLDLEPPFRARANAGEQLHFVYDGHWNPAGNALAASAIADYTARARLLDPPVNAAHRGATIAEEKR